jgi:predicted Rossmann fold flavoprotein
MAAIAAAQAGCDVMILEHMPRVGQKLLATGGGRCNLTNTADVDAFLAGFGRQGRFILPALEAMDPPSLREFFEDLGVPTEADEEGHVFPISQSAAAVLSALVRRCDQLHVRTRLRTAAAELIVENGQVVGVAKDVGRIAARCVVLAAGGQSYPKLGSNGSGLEIARSAGHSIVPPVPALVPLVIQEPWVGRCTGISVRARIWLDIPGRPKAGVTGDILFTHRGLSGPCVLDISGEAAALLARGKSVPLRLELVSGVTAAQWTHRLAEWRTTLGRRRLHTLVAQYMPARLATELCAAAGIGEDDHAAHILAPAARKLVELLTATPLTVVGTEGFEAAMVTRGGVALKEVDPHTLASRLVRGLYFAGEVLDLDGPCGGYNLQWAFSSGFLAGRSAAESLAKSLPQE